MCQGGQCMCQPPFVLSDCSARDNLILPGEVVSDTVSADQWAFFHTTVYSTTAFYVRVEEMVR